MKTYLENKFLGFLVKTNGFFSKRFFSGIGHILTFHRVLPQSSFTIPENKVLEVSPHFLEKLIFFYKEHKYDFVSLDTVYERLEYTKKSKSKFVAFTFDDGYADVYEYAFPLMQKHNVPLNLYITTDFPDKKAFLWWYMIDDLFKNNKRITFQYQNNEVVLNSTTDKEKQKGFKFLRNIILNDYSNYKSVFNNIISDYALCAEKYAHSETLSWEHIKKMSAHELVCIGNHSISHPVFNRLTQEQIVFEVLTSKQIIENHIQKEVSHFAYPYGGKDEVGRREFDILKDLNFKTCTTTRLSNIFKGHSAFTECLPRIGLAEGMSDEKLINHMSGITQYNRNKFKRIVTE